MSGMVSSIRCVVHYLDNKNLNVTLAYLKSAWNSELVGSDRFYIVKVESRDQLKVLNVTYLFDFKKLFIIVPISVSKSE